MGCKRLPVTLSAHCVVAQKRLMTYLAMVQTVKAAIFTQREWLSVRGMLQKAFIFCRCRILHTVVFYTCSIVHNFDKALYNSLYLLSDYQLSYDNMDDLNARTGCILFSQELHET